MLSNLKFAALVAAVAVLATTLWQAVDGQTAAAKPPAKAAANISKAEVWETWPFQDSDEYVGHEKCGAPIAVHKWDRNGWVNYHKLCVKVTVKARCGCTKLTTTYIKYEGEAKWLHGTVNSESEDVKCPVPIAKEVIAQCKAEEEAKKMCLSLRRVNFKPKQYGPNVSVALKCPDGILPDYDSSPAYLETCDLCQPMTVCDGEQAAESEAAFTKGCKVLRKEHASLIGYVLPNSPHRVYLRPERGVTPPAAGSTLTAADCDKFESAKEDHNPSPAVQAHRALCAPPNSDD